VDAGTGGVLDQVAAAELAEDAHGAPQGFVATALADRLAVFVQARASTPLSRISR
jgi:hypothetical protein